MTAAWLFLRHGQRERARTLIEALVEDDPRDGVSAAALAELLLDAGEAPRALDVIRMATFPAELAHAEAVLESRALRLVGRHGEADARWRRYLESRKGTERRWV